jgi:anti-sigma factor RsiW
VDIAAVEQPISSDDLHAYVDERLDPDRRREVESYLDAQPQLARRVTSYRAQREGLRDALAAPALEPVPATLNLSRLLEARLARRPPWWRLAAAVALCVGVAGAAGWYLGSSRSPSRIELAISLLQQEAIASHAVYAADGRHPVEVTAADADHLSQWLSNRLRRNVTPPDLSVIGYRLLGGRLLATERGGAAALFVYADASGNRLSVLLRPMAPELRAQRADIAQGGLNGCTWIREGMGYAVVADTSDQILDQAADQISKQTSKPG